MSRSETVELRSKLNERQIMFVHGLIDGMSQRQAYAAAYKCSLESAEASSTKLLGNLKVKAYRDHLLDQATNGVVYTRQKKRERLHMIGEGLLDQPVSPGEMIQAIKTDNDMTGDNKPIRVEGELTLGIILASLQPTNGLPRERLP